ncbi:Mth938-like domain-containing protein [Archaeoglobus sp.]
MKVERYDFGLIKLDGQEFKHDVIVYGDFVKKWWREEGHRVQVEDVEDILKLRPEIVVIGTGYYGVVKVDRDVIEKLKNEGIDVICEESREAVETYNRLLEEGKKVALAIHLTC